MTFLGNRQTSKIDISQNYNYLIIYYLLIHCGSFLSLSTKRKYRSKTSIFDIKEEIFWIVKNVYLRFMGNRQSQKIQNYRKLWLIMWYMFSTPHLHQPYSKKKNLKNHQFLAEKMRFLVVKVKILISGKQTNSGNPKLLKIRFIVYMFSHFGLVLSIFFCTLFLIEHENFCLPPIFFQKNEQKAWNTSKSEYCFWD